MRSDFGFIAGDGQDVAGGTTWLASVLLILTCWAWEPVLGVWWQVRGAAAWDGRIVQALGVLMHRSFRMSEDVYQAMLARGFDHQFRTMAFTRFGVADAALVGVSMILAIAAVIVNGRLA